ncbi:hypothetical protein [Clostridium sp. Marseille-Q2269]|uniref:hypothetical protein n=1 Tax=Clostridium sp. Marseille-Q2269 TaxID=2942205 RepID=UPI002074A3D2|nr:hypothetical protein [Clostridium sp. Marseille-Q2269]
MKINFIPESYIQMNYKKVMKKYIVLIIVLFTINIVFFNKTLYSLKNIHCIKEEINILHMKKKKKSIDNIKKDNNYNLFISLYENMNKDILLDNLIIKEGRVYLDGKCVYLDSYYSLLNLLEKDKKVTIKNLNTPKKENDFYKFRFILE